MNHALLLAILLAASAARAETDHANEISISLGGGLAYELAGVNIAARSEHFEGYLGVGLLSLLTGLSGGGRFFLRPDGSGFFVGLNLAVHTWQGGLFDNNGSTGGHAFWTTVTPGYRAAWNHFFLQAAVGGGFLYSATFWKTPPSPDRQVAAIPDVMLALGSRF